MTKRQSKQPPKTAGYKRRKGAPPLRPDPEVHVSPGLRRGFVLLILALMVVLVLSVVLQNRSGWLGAFADSLTVPPIQTTPLTTPSPTPDPKRIGIVSGHRNNDSGTVCDDGLTEAAVNFDIATRAARNLRDQGYTVDILGEFDPALKGYQARVLLSIHADSCKYINDLATGYKVARVLDSRVPDTEDRLVACLTARYKNATGMRFHKNTITYDMTKYHAFYEIAPETPAAIIETGFLNLDRPILIGRSDDVARGVSDGLLCFLRGEEP